MSNAWLPWTVVPIVLVGAPILLYGFTQADRLVRAEYESHRSDWERDGFPAGFFFWPPGARRGVPFSWLFRAPSWVHASPTYARWLRRYRTCALIWNLLCIPLFLAMLYALVRQNV